MDDGWKIAISAAVSAVMTAFGIGLKEAFTDWWQLNRARTAIWHQFTDELLLPKQVVDLREASRAERTHVNFASMATVHRLCEQIILLDPLSARHYESVGIQYLLAADRMQRLQRAWDELDAATDEQRVVRARATEIASLNLASALVAEHEAALVVLRVLSHKNKDRAALCARFERRILEAEAIRDEWRADFDRREAAAPTLRQSDDLIKAALDYAEEVAPAPELPEDQASMSLPPIRTRV